MDTVMGAMLGFANRGKEPRVFDWAKAARYIVEHGVKDARAGLSSDMEYTAGEILRDGAPVPQDDTYTYLASNWAEPVMEIDGEEVPCWSWQHEVPDYGAKTYWPAEALAILRGEEVRR